MHVHVRVCVCVCAPVCMHACVYTCVCVCVCVCYTLQRKQMREIFLLTELIHGERVYTEF